MFAYQRAPRHALTRCGPAIRACAFGNFSKWGPVLGVAQTQDRRAPLGDGFLIFGAICYRRPVWIKKTDQGRGRVGTPIWIKKPDRNSSGRKPTDNPIRIKTRSGRSVIVSARIRLFQILCRKISQGPYRNFGNWGK